MLKNYMRKALEDEEVSGSGDAESEKDTDLSSADPVEPKDGEEDKGAAEPAKDEGDAGGTSPEDGDGASEPDANGDGSEGETPAAGDDDQTPSADDLAEPDEDTIKILGIGDLAVDKVAEAEATISNKIKSTDEDIKEGDLEETERQVDVSETEKIADDATEAMEAMRLDIVRFGCVAPGTVKLLNRIYSENHAKLFGQKKSMRGAMEDHSNPRRRGTAQKVSMEDWRSMLDTAYTAILAFIKKARRWFNEFIKAKFSFTIEYIAQIEKYTRAIIAQRSGNKDKIDGALINKTVNIGGKKTNISTVGNTVLDKEHFIQDMQLAEIFMAVNPNPSSQTGGAVVQAVHFVTHFRALAELSQRFVKINDMMSAKFSIGDYLKTTVVDTINGDSSALHFSQGTRESFMSSRQMMMHDNPAVYEMYTKDGTTPAPIAGKNPDAGCAWWYIPHQFENYISAVHLRIDVALNGIPDNELDTVDMYAKWRLETFGRAPMPYEGTGWLRWMGDSELSQCTELVLRALKNLRHVESNLSAYNKKVDELEKNVEEVNALLKEHRSVSNLTPSGMSYTVDQLANMVLSGISNVVSVVNSVMKTDGVYVQRIGMAWARFLALIYARETELVSAKQTT